MNRSSPGASWAWRIVVRSCAQDRAASAALNRVPARARSVTTRKSGAANSAKSAATSTKRRRRRLAVGIGADAGEQQDADEQRPAVAERDPDSGEAAAGDRLRDVGKHRVVVDERGLVGEVGDREGDETEPDVDEAD